MLKCNFCIREFKNAGGLATHQPFCKENPARIQRLKSHNAHSKKGSIPWNKGLKGDLRCKKSAECIAKLKEKASGRAATPEAEQIRKNKIKEKAKLNNGGYRQGSGRGKKGKIGEALSHGIPVVTTSIGAEGFNFENEKDAFISDDPENFVKYILELHSNQSLWENASLNAYNYAKSNLSTSAFKDKLQNILKIAIGE